MSLPSALCISGFEPHASPYIAITQVYRLSSSSFYKLQIIKSSDKFLPVYNMLPWFWRLKYLEKRCWFIFVPTVPTSQDEKHFVDLMDSYSWIILDTSLWLGLIECSLRPRPTMTVLHAWSPLISTITWGKHCHHPILQMIKWSLERSHNLTQFTRLLNQSHDALIPKSTVKFISSSVVPFILTAFQQYSSLQCKIALLELTYGARVHYLKAKKQRPSCLGKYLYTHLSPQSEMMPLSLTRDLLALWPLSSFPPLICAPSSAWHGRLAY